MTTQTPLRQITVEEVKRHNTDANLWIIVRDKVYDLTKFQHEHPGGWEVILDVAGKEATKDFDVVGHSPAAIKQMKKYEIGEIVESERKFKSKSSSDFGAKSSILLAVSAAAVGVGALIITKALKMRNNL